MQLESVSIHQTIDGVDPWALQRANMIQSDQSLPDKPTITKDSLLYYALILEECAELGKALRGIITAAGSDIVPNIDEAMHEASLNLRTAIKGLRPESWVDVTREQARELMDGTTDLTVVNSGFANATGLQGAEAYRRVQVSNLSKANPETGKIDKTPDGKWIKGVDFKLPELDDLCGG
jgi:hypothetical protein